MGRKKIVINWVLVNELLECGCNGTEVAARLGICEDTLYNACQRDNKQGFSAYKAQKRANGNSILRVEQFKLAKTGDRAMLIWLGKQRLDQVDKKEEKSDVTQNHKVSVSHSEIQTTKDDEISDDIQ